MAFRLSVEMATLPPAVHFDQQALDAAPPDAAPLYLLTVANAICAYVHTLQAESIWLLQIPLEREISSLLLLPSHNPTRPLRNVLARAIHAIFARGGKLESGLADGLLQLLLEPGKDREKSKETDKDKIRERDLARRHAAAECLGALVAGAGARAQPIVSSAANALIKQSKTNIGKSAHGFRGAIFSALARIVQSAAGSALPEATSRLVWKLARTAAVAERTDYVRIRALGCMGAIVWNCDWCRGKVEYGKLRAAIDRCYEACDSARSGLAKNQHGGGSALRRAIGACWTTGMLVHLVSDSSLDPPQDDPHADPKEDPKKDKDLLRMELPDILTELRNAYLKAGSNRIKAGAAQAYIALLSSLPQSLVESRHTDLIDHILSLVNIPTDQTETGKYRQLMHRKIATLILSHANSCLGEESQLEATKKLAHKLEERLHANAEGHKGEQMAVLLGALEDIMPKLGAAVASALGDVLRVVVLTAHPVYAVQVHTARMLQKVVVSHPASLTTVLGTCLATIEREFAAIGTDKWGPQRSIGAAISAAGILSIAGKHPLYGPGELYGRVVQQATGLIKTATRYDVRVSAIVVQVAWILLAGVMALPRAFVRPLVGQVMVLWKNALPKAMRLDEISKRSRIELAFLAHVRECALGAMMIFLRHHSDLSGGDVSRRVCSMISNSISFVRAIELSPSAAPTGDSADKLLGTNEVGDYLALAKRRLFECASFVSGGGWDEATAVQMALTIFTGDIPAPGSVKGAQPSSMINVIDIWDAADNSGFGMASGKLFDRALRPPHEVNLSQYRLYSRDERWDVHERIEGFIRQPIAEAVEHDGLEALLGNRKEAIPCPNVGVVNAAIEYFASAFLNQHGRIQETVLDQMKLKLEESEGPRKAAISVNITAMFALALTRKTDVKTEWDEKVLSGILTILHSLVRSPDPLTRQLAAVAFGGLCSRKSDIATAQIGEVVAAIMATPDPSARAGYSSVLSRVVSQVGLISAGPHMRHITGLLNSLVLDSHPVVHFWALDALATVVEAAGQAMGRGSVTGLLGVLALAAGLDGHGVDGNGLAAEAAGASVTVGIDWVNREARWETSLGVTAVVDAIIRSVGPGIAEGTLEASIGSVLGALEAESLAEERCPKTKPPSCSDAAVSDSAKAMTAPSIGMLRLARILRTGLLACHEQVALVAPNSPILQDYVLRLRSGLAAGGWSRLIAVRGLHNLLQRNPELMMEIEDALWTVSDAEAPDEDVESVSSRLGLIVASAVAHLISVSGWVQRCEEIVLGRVRGEGQAERERERDRDGDKNDNDPDEEVAGFAANKKSDRSHIKPRRWRGHSQALALQCLIAVVQTHPEDAASLPNGVSVLVNLAFAACTAPYPPLRHQGLVLLSECIRIFAPTPDPVFAHLSVLEQYAAQIGSAVMSAVSSPKGKEMGDVESLATLEAGATAFSGDVMAAAMGLLVGSQFLRTGVVQEENSMGRVLNLLNSAAATLHDSQASPFSGFAPLAREMLDTVALAGWAQIYVDSQRVPECLYLRPIVDRRVKPEGLNSRSLPAAWMDGIRRAGMSIVHLDDYLFDMQQLSAGGPREKIFPILKQASLIFGDALIELGQRSGKELASMVTVEGIDYADEPVALFFVLLGIVAQRFRPASSALEMDEILRLMSGKCSVFNPEPAAEPDAGEVSAPLVALHGLLTSPLAREVGPAFFENAVYGETFALIVNLAEEGLRRDRNDVWLTHVVEIINSLAGMMPLGDINIDQLFDLARVSTMLLQKAIPCVVDPAVRSQVEAVTLSPYQLSVLSCLLRLVSLFPDPVGIDMQTCLCETLFRLFEHGAGLSVLPIWKGFVLLAARNGGVRQRLLPLSLRKLVSIMVKAKERENPYDADREQAAALWGSVVVIQLLRAKRDAGKDDREALLDTLIGSEYVPALIDALDSNATARVAAGCIKGLLGALRDSTVPEFSASLVTAVLRYIVAGGRGLAGSLTDGTDLVRAHAVVSAAAAEWAQRAAVDGGVTEGSANAVAVVLGAILGVAESVPAQSGDDDSADGKAAAGAWRRRLGAQVLVLAQAGDVFKLLVGTLGEKREILQELLAAAMGAQEDAGGEPTGPAEAGPDSEEGTPAAPRIELRMNFGN